MGMKAHAPLPFRLTGVALMPSNRTLLHQRTLIVLEEGAQAQVWYDAAVMFVFLLLVARNYTTKEQIRELMEPYRASSDEAFDRMFERDKDELRELGIPVGSIGPQRARCLERMRRSSALAALGEGEEKIDIRGGEPGA